MHSLQGVHGLCGALRHTFAVHQGLLRLSFNALLNVIFPDLVLTFDLLYTDFNMASSSTAPTVQLVPYKFQGRPKRSRFFDAHFEIKDNELGHMDWNGFLKICNNPHNRPEFITKMIRCGLVNVAAHPISVQSSKLIMAIAQNYVPDEKIVWAIIGEMVLDIKPHAIQRAYHLLASDSYLSISYKDASRWYKEHRDQADETI